MLCEPLSEFDYLYGLVGISGGNGDWAEIFKRRGLELLRDLESSEDVVLRTDQFMVWSMNIAVDGRRGLTKSSLYSQVYIP